MARTEKGNREMVPAIWRPATETSEKIKATYTWTEKENGDLHRNAISFEVS